MLEPLADDISAITRRPQKVIAISNKGFYTLINCAWTNPFNHNGYTANSHYDHLGNAKSVMKWRDYINREINAKDRDRWFPPTSPKFGQKEHIGLMWPPNGSSLCVLMNMIFKLRNKLNDLLIFSIEEDTQ